MKIHEYQAKELLRAAGVATPDNIVAKTGRTPEQARAELAKANPQGRLIQPGEVADTVAWLVQAAGVNGQAVAVCGGETM